MRVLGYPSSQNKNLRKLNESKLARRGVTGFFIGLMLFNTAQLSVFALLQERAYAAERNIPALESERLETAELEPGVVGAPKGDQQDVTKDPAVYTHDVFEEKELVNERDRFTEVLQNEDGSKTLNNYLTPRNYQKDGKWQVIDTTLVEDTNAADGGWFASALGWVESVFRDEETFKVKENDWQAKFAPSDDEVGMVRVQQNNQTVAFRPVGAKPGVTPVIRWVEDKQYVNYYDLWPGVNVEYTVGTAQIKLNVVLKDKDATNNIGFVVQGATLTEDTENAGVYDIKGALGDAFNILPVNLIRNKYGFETQPVYKQEFKDGQLRIWADKEYLQSQPADAYPVVIDPTVQNSSFGTRASGNYVSFKSDGYVCPSTTCNPMGGSLLDTNNVWRAWRSAIHSPYSFLSGKDLVSANLHLTQRTGASFWTGNYNPHWFSAYWATCLNSFNCLTNPSSSSYFSGGTWGDIDVTELYKQRLAAGDFGAWVMIAGEECGCDTYKNFDPDNSYVTFTYANKPPASTAAYPADKKVLVTDQPQLAVNSLSEPSGENYKYYFRVATGSDAESGMIINSGDIDANTWTLPAGVLQDGQTYYWKVFTRNWVNGGLVGTTPSSWVRSFKFDARAGKDPTQAFNTAGPVSVGLATGNATTSAATHGMSALGGNIGVGLEYNSPVMSKQGLLAEYFNNTSFSGTPVVSRVEQKVDFNWSTGSPSFGVMNSDNFSSRFTGYFIAPKTGSYKFGGNNDDSLNIFINNSGTASYSNGGCYSGVCMGTAAVALTAGQVVPIRIQHVDATGPSYAKAYVKIDSDPEQIIPSEWLRTEPAPTSPKTGLTASYFADAGSHTLPSNNSTAFASRIEPKLTFNYGSGSAVPTGQSDNFISRHEGYITVPVTGTYQFGTVADDAARVYVDNQLVVNDWVQDGSVSTVWGSNVVLTAGQSVPIRVEYYELSGGSHMKLNVKGAVTQQEVPATWLSSRVEVLPDGWELGLDAAGDLGYDYARISSQNVILYDAAGTKHEYTYDSTKKTYAPPVNEYGTLVRNSDGSITLQDEDGKTYVFNADGRLREVATVTDDRNPAALKYEYSGTPPRLTRVIDGVDPSRYGTLYYKGDSQCATAPSGFDSTPPNNMLCAFVTTDGDRTDFFYKSGQLARLQLPGNEITDLGYDSSGRIIQHRSSLANDAILAGVRGNDAGVTTELTYDTLGRVSSITEPAANAGEGRQVTEYDYLPTTATGTATVVGYSQVREIGTSMPNGFTKRVEFDATYRTVKDIDKANLSTLTEWDTVKDLVLSSTTPTGLKSTTIYDTVGNDRPIQQYGPAPVAWFGADRKPLATYVTQIPRQDTNYDEGIPGLEIKVFANKTLTGLPKIHKTGLAADGSGKMARNYGSEGPIPDVGDNWSWRATGKIKLSATGSHTFRIWSDNGTRLYIDNVRVIDDWVDGAQRNHTAYVYSNTVANSYHDIRVEYYHATGNSDFSLKLTSPGAAETNMIGNLLTPNYGLTTSTKVYDSVLGDVTSTTNYGASPELGLAQSSTVDPTGLNLTGSATYETPGASGTFLRQTSTSLSGGNTTTYAYYGATETRDNPCTTDVEAFAQAGRSKITTEQDPDGAGPAASRTKEAVYNHSGELVASRMNSDPWTCVTYDARHRVTKTDQPTISSRPGRVIEQFYDVLGNPLKSKTVDSVVGTSESEVDLLGRAKWAKDVWGNEYTVTYDANGRVSSKTSPVGTESSDYDTLDRATNYKLDGIALATLTYDSFSRVQTIDYPEAKDSAGNKLTLTQVKRDSLDRNNGVVYQTSDGKTFDETVVLSQVGKITGATQVYDGQTLTSSFTFDKLGRMLSANVGQTKFEYSYNAPDISCSAVAGYNANAHKDSNRTSYRVTNLATSAVVQDDKHCYDMADRLVSSTDAQIGTPTYDDHGNTVSLAGGGAPIAFGYNASDHNVSIEQGTNKTEYVKTPDGSILRKKEYVSGSLTTSYRYVAGSRILQTCNLTDDNDCTTVDTYLNLPGNITLTKTNPSAQPNVAKQTVYSLKNYHGDTALTFTAEGKTDSTDPNANLLKAYGPFGEALLPGTPGSTTSTAINASDTTMGWAASPTRKQEQAFTLGILQMGARVYIPTLGRFLQTDPIQGGTLNPYVYAHDPINMDDYSGESIWSFLATAAKVVTRGVKAITSNKRVVAAVRTVVAAAPKPAASNTLPFIAGALSFTGDLSKGIKTQSSVFGGQLQKGSSTAGRYLPSVSRVAKNSALGTIGKVAGPAAFGVEFGSNYLEGDSIGRNVLKTGGGVAGGIGGGFLGAAACVGVSAVSIGTLTIPTCPGLIAGGGLAGSIGGNKFGEGIANWLGL